MKRGDYLQVENSDLTRVKFYSVNDLSTGFFIDRVEEVVERFNSDIEIIDVNQIIELYNVQLFFKYKIYSRNWTDEKIKQYEGVIKQFTGIIAKYFSKINSCDYEKVLSLLEWNYSDDFWRLTEKYKSYERISASDFKYLLNNSRISVLDILLCKFMVKKFGKELRDYIKENISCAEILFGQYIQKVEKNTNKYYFPDELISEDKCELINNYIEWEEANPNYLKLISEAKGSKEFPLTDKIRLKAKRSYEKKIDEMFKNSNGLKYGVEVSFSGKMSNEKQVFFENNMIKATYSTRWIKENLDYPTILNNFIYLFEFTDMQFRYQHVCKESMVGIFEQTLGVKGKNEYVTGTVFNQIQMLADVQMLGYYNELERNNILIENVIKWFFEEYLLSEFNVQGFHFNVPSVKSSYLEKCRAIAPEMDSILKQFKIWCEEKELDKELLQYSTTHMFIKDIPSMLKNKYIYADEEKCNFAMHLLFSDQSRIHYIPNMTENYHSFYDLILTNHIEIEKFQEYQKYDIKWLQENGMIDIDEYGIIIPHRKKMWILNELYNNEVLCSKYIYDFADELSEIYEQGLIRYASSLFSKPEQDYYNYLFNKSEFDNGLDIRNTYIHGTQVDNNKQNNRDYFTLLRMIILIIIKINEEFCLVND